MSNSYQQGKYTTPCRVRSFRGCGTCRSRHIKCDETRPSCTTCRETGVICDSYNRRIFFTAGDDRQGKFRQLLFTDEEREELNSCMLQVVPLHKANTALMSIEEWSEKADQSEIFRGPFGAFRLPRPAATADLWDPSSFELPDWIETSPFLGESTMAPSWRTPSPQIALNPIVLDTQPNDDRLWEATFQNAPLLLKHYAETLIPMMTPIRHQKTPWHVLFLPSTKSTLATITIGQEADAASLTTFFGTLTLSAISLQHQSSGEVWSSLAQLFKSRATECLRDTLKHALDVPKRFKYKSIIMAILTMVQVSMADGSWDHTDNLLIEAEKIIRLRGLGRPYKSRKVRILHHCYAYARIFQESISLTSSRSPLQLDLVTAVQSSGIMIKGSDSPFFCLGVWEDLEEKFNELKTQEIGENDLHLASPGIWGATLYTEIFGVPETWLTLLSQTIRLANEKEMCETLDHSILSLKEFSSRAKALERYISRSSKSFATEPPGDVQRYDPPPISQLMQSALYCALTIYFYRRIYDVDSGLLQPQVVLVKDYLVECKRLCNSDRVFDALMWPAFVSGCEAIEPEHQAFFSAWFDSNMVHSKHSAHGRMKQLMQKVWEHRKQDCRSPVNWFQFLHS